ncbi:MAG: type II toxin-antitoxin system PemK/MazF family toxin [Deltaproteobacteria bacterium]|nr:type II toxin-antitoxin system PemK/MazF family toxin [Deltaproteobacteria bacterium]
MARHRARLAAPRRGDVYFVSLDPTVGAEIQKTRPAVVVQNDSANRASPITIVAAITSQTEPRSVYVTNVPIAKGDGGLTAPSLVLTNQLRSVDRQRLIRRIGALRPDTMRRVDRALAISLDLAES